MKKFLIASIILVWGLSAHAAPSISGVSGTVSNGQSITISGSAFGTKSPAAPLVWDNFEGGTAGQVLTGKTPVVGSAWTTYTSGSTVPVYDNAVNKTNSTRSVRSDYYINPDYTIGLTKSLTTTTGSELFFSYYWRYHRRSTAYADNNKPWMIWGTAGSGAPMAYVGYGDLSDSSARDAHEDDPMPSTSSTYGSSQIDDFDDTWVRIDTYLKQSAANTANGALKYWVNGALDINHANTITRTTSNTWDLLLLGCFIRQNQPVQIYMDDVYIDITQARVEIGNASTWAACTHKEIQPPTAWSASSVTVTVNRGSFGATDAAYLYVVDSTGAVNSSGYAITFGDTPSPTMSGATCSGCSLNVP